MSEDIAGYAALNFDGLERRANYRFIGFREDILQALDRNDAAAILFEIIWRWQIEYRREEIMKENERRKKANLPLLSTEEVEERMWVYMSYNDFVRESGGAIGYNTVIRTLDFLINTKKVFRQRPNHNPHYPDFEYSINKEEVRKLLKTLPATPKFTPKKPKKKGKQSTQMGIPEQDSTQMGIPAQNRGSTQTGTPVYPNGYTPSTQMGTGVYPFGGTSQYHTISSTESSQREGVALSAHTTPTPAFSSGDHHATTDTPAPAQLDTAPADMDSRRELPATPPVAHENGSHSHFQAEPYAYSQRSMQTTQGDVHATTSHPLSADDHHSSVAHAFHPAEMDSAGVERVEPPSVAAVPIRNTSSIGVTFLEDEPETVTETPFAAMDASVLAVLLEREQVMLAAMTPVQRAQAERTYPDLCVVIGEDSDYDRLLTAGQCLSGRAALAADVCALAELSTGDVDNNGDEETVKGAAVGYAHPPVLRKTARRPVGGEKGGVRDGMRPACSGDRSALGDRGTALPAEPQPGSARPALAMAEAAAAEAGQEMNAVRVTPPDNAVLIDTGKREAARPQGEQEIPAGGRKRGSRSPRGSTKKTLSAEQEGRIAAVYEALDTFYREVMPTDATGGYARTKAGDAAILELIDSRQVTRTDLLDVCRDMWDEESKNRDTGVMEYWWRAHGHMTVAAICHQVPVRLLSIRSRRQPKSGQHGSGVLSRPTLAAELAAKQAKYAGV